METPMSDTLREVVSTIFFALHAVSWSLRPFRSRRHFASARTYNLDIRRSYQMHFAVFSDDVLANPAAILPIGRSGAPETNVALIGDSDFKVPAAVEFADLLWSRGGRFKDLIGLGTLAHLLAPFAEPREALWPTAKTIRALQEKSTHSGRAMPTRITNFSRGDHSAASEKRSATETPTHLARRNH
jgi:hypothetical protein